MSSEGLARGAGELSCAELNSTFSSPPSGSGFSIFGAAGGADVPSFLSGRRFRLRAVAQYSLDYSGPLRVRALHW